MNSQGKMSLELTGMNVAREANAQPDKERGISRDTRTTAYFRVPELTIPHRNWKIYGKAFATSLETHKLSQTHSTQENIQTMRTPPKLALLATVAPMIIGTAIKAAKGRT